MTKVSKPQKADKSFQLPKEIREALSPEEQKPVLLR